MDTVEAGLFKFLIDYRTGILPAPEAVLVGQAGKPAPQQKANFHASSIIFLNFSKRYLESCGPGEASG